MNDTREESIRLGRRTYESRAIPETNANASDDFLFVLPSRPGRLILTRHGNDVHNRPVVPGMVRIVRPGERSSMTILSGFHSLVLRVPGSVVEATADGGSDGARDSWRDVLPADATVRRLSTALEAAGTLHRSRRRAYLDGPALALVALARSLSEGDAPDDRARPTTDPLSDEEWSLVEGYAESRLRSGLSVEGWADALEMSTGRFSGRFVARTGLSPYAWFLGRRVERAKMLLADGWTLVDVALALGFSSQSHFNHAFRRRVGISPGLWRRDQAAGRTSVADH